MFIIGNFAFLSGFYGEEKSLRHMAMVAKFLDDNKLKCHLHCKKWIRTASNFIDLISLL